MEAANLVIRPMRTEDGPAVLAIFSEGISGGNATFDTKAPEWNIWDQNHLAACRFVLENAGKVVGWAALKNFSNRDCYRGVAEVSIYLSSKVQGKGYGQRLLKRLIEESEISGFWTLQAGIFPENTASINLHKRNGFRTVGLRERIAQMNGKWRDVVLMERRSGSL